MMRRHGGQNFKILDVAKHFGCHGSTVSAWRTGQNDVLLESLGNGVFIQSRVGSSDGVSLNLVELELGC